MMENCAKKPERFFLNPSRKLVDETVDWLCGNDRYPGRIRTTAEGAQSLDHVMVVVPTAQSGRNLRLALARRFNGRGLIPPRIVQPIHLVVPRENGLREASTTEVAAAFQQYIKENRESVLALGHLVRKEEFDDLTARFALLDQLEDIWRILAGRGLLMQDVPELGKAVFEEDIGDEGPRWKELAELERGFFDYLKGLGLAYPTQSVCLAKESAAILPEEVEEIVLPALADPVRVFEDVLKQQLAAGKKVTVLFHADERDESLFDMWGRPKTECWTGERRPELHRLADSDIVVAADISSLSRRLVSDYPSAESGASLPSLALCDADLYDGLAGAFLVKGYVVHNPERHPLAQSSLGRMIRGLIAIYDSKDLPWREFVLFFRSDDVLSALGLQDEKRAEVLAGLDIAQNVYFPAEIPSDFRFPADDGMRDSDKEKLDAFFRQGRKVEGVFSDARQGSGIAGFVRKVLRWVFADRKAACGAAEKEFNAAVDAAREFLNELEGGVVAGLDATWPERTALARRVFSSACYSLEPETPEAIKTEGWLELAWSPSERIALAGLHEGKVPDSVVGHPFLPDKLRKALGLTSNDDRLARDSWLLYELLASHGEHSIHAYVARTDDKGDICRPSRLLYLCSDTGLPARVSHLFGDIPSTRGPLVKKVDWPLRLPRAVDAPGHFSPSAIDTYVKCPLNYLLKYGLRMKPYKEKSELGADDFGTLVHAALEMYAKDQIDRMDDQFTDASEIRSFFTREVFPKIREKFKGASLNIDLQIQALEGRLDLFAVAQAEWAEQGWRIRMAEKEVPADLDIEGLGFRVHGYVDRVDENINIKSGKRWCVIDYKTWDEATLINHVFTSDRTGGKNDEQLAFAREMGYPLLKNRKGDEKQRVLSVQLPVYGMCIAALEPRAGFEEQRFQYLVLGKNEEKVGFRELQEGFVDVSIKTAKQAVENIKAGIFWPPGPGEEWKWDFKGLFAVDPVKDLGESDWAASHRKTGGTEVNRD